MPGREATEALDEKVVGQRRAKRALSTLVDMHLAWFEHPNPLHHSPNGLVIGPTGTGKTHAIRVLADALDIPLVIVDSTRLVATGAHDHLRLDEVLRQLVKNALRIQTKEKPERLAERGVVFLDEFDKLNYENTSDDTAAIQRRLLQFIEGDTIDLEPDEEGEPRKISTHGILFIAAGAFSGIEDMAARRSIESSRTPGVLHSIQADDVHAYGFLHELVARLNVIIRFDALAKVDLRQILEHPIVSPMTFYSSYFADRGYELRLAPETLDQIALAAENLGLGARGLHQELFPILSELASEIVVRTVGDGAPLEEIKLTKQRYEQLKARMIGPYDDERDAR